MRVFLMGYPGDLGGACTEAWHTVKIWRRFDVDVHLIPTWNCDDKWRSRVDELGCVTHQASAATLHEIPDLAGAIVVSFCNSAFLSNAMKLREMGCRLAWVNCMTWLFNAEKDFYRQSAPFDAFVFQSEFQRKQLEPQLAEFGYDGQLGHLIRGAFDVDEWPFAPRPHVRGGALVVGRAARPDQDKWSSNTWPIYNRIQYHDKRALMLGMDDRTHQKLGTPPSWADCLKPMAISAGDYFRQLHCTLPVNGGARENWPRVGLEAMAAGVPVVAQNEWGCCVWDDDDVYLPWHMSAAASAIADADYTIPTVIYKDKGDRLERKANQYLFHGAWAFRRTAFNQVGGYPFIQSGQDQGLLRRFKSAKLRRADPIQFDSRPSYIYRWFTAHSKHISAMGADGYERLAHDAVDPIASLNPHWDRDWSRLASDEARATAESA